MTVQTCWQYARKKQLAGAGPCGSRADNFLDCDIRPVDYQTAKDFILQYEWLGNMGTSKYCFGLFFSGQLVSVVCYGPLVAPTHYGRLLALEDRSRIIQICRGATGYWAPTWAPSKLICRSLKHMHTEFGILAAIGYADPRAGEIGTIYQACNAYYIGMTCPGGGKRYIINGHTYDPRKVHKKFGSRAHAHLARLDPNYKAVPINPKHRYLFVLGTKQQRMLIAGRIEHLVRPYPKRQ